ncbi:MAG: M90 family metallopeptidase [Brumimicrobium sp.]|nr:M90 family metallopeptidase [Brumimicrobium sp.]
MKKYKNILWAVVFVFLLVIIPWALYSEGVSPGRIAGFVIVVLLGIAIGYYRLGRKKRPKRKSRIRFNANDKFWLEKHIPFYEELAKSDRKIFLDRMGLFLSDILVTEVDRDETEKETSMYVAASAVIAYWGLPYYNYGDLSEVLVYPSNFNADNSLNKQGVIGGKVYHGGIMDQTMILSLPELKKGFQIDNDKKNVGVHEFAHLLDKSDGSIDGIPPLMEDDERKLWLRVMEKEMERIREDESTVPDYGGTNKTEFFAVVTEYYKECPHLLKVKHPELYKVLDNYYSGDERIED